MRFLPFMIVSLALLTGCSANQAADHASQTSQKTATSRSLALKSRLALVALAPEMQDSGLDTTHILQNRLQLTAYRFPTHKVITDAPSDASVYQLQVTGGTSGYHMVYLQGDKVIFGDLDAATTKAKFEAEGTATTISALAKHTNPEHLRAMRQVLSVDNQTIMHQETTITTKDTRATFDGHADMANMTRQKAITWAWNHYHHHYLNDGTSYILANYKVECVKGTDGTWTITFRKPVAGSTMTQLAAQYQITASGKLLAMIANAEE